MQDRPHADIVRDNLTSIQAHILQEERRHPGASGDFSMIISAISLAGKAIAAKVRRANLEDVLGASSGRAGKRRVGIDEQRYD